MQLNSSWLQLAWEDCTQQVNEVKSWWVREVFFIPFWRGQICSFHKGAIPLYFAMYQEFSSVYFYLTFVFFHVLKSLKSWSHCVWNIKVMLTILYQKNLGISQRSSLWVGRMGVWHIFVGFLVCTNIISAQHRSQLRPRFTKIYTPICSKILHNLKRALAQVFHIIWIFSSWVIYQRDLRIFQEASVDDAQFDMGIRAQFCSLQTDTKKFNGLGKVKQEVSPALILKSKISVAECE